MKEQEVMQMEMLEMELIKKLQNTQAIQKEAYAELEKALSQPSKMIGSYLMKNVLSNPVSTKPPQWCSLYIFI